MLDCWSTVVYAVYTWVTLSYLNKIHYLSNKKSELYVITLKSPQHVKYRLSDCLYEKVCFLVIDMNGEQNSYIFNG